MLQQNKLKSRFSSHSTIKTNRKEAMYAYNIHKVSVFGYIKQHGHSVLEHEIDQIRVGMPL